MPELKNRFSWSHSAATAFEQCRRKRYWGKYAAWGGWDSAATVEQRAAYRLGKMTSLPALLGIATEDALVAGLRRLQAGEQVHTADLYAQYARPMLNRCWQESQTKLWEKDPKRYCCLQEHYYRRWDKEAARRAAEGAKQKSMRCLDFFLHEVWPRLKDVDPAMEVAVASGQGTPESFELEGLQVYAIPDYVHRDAELWHIHDWKTGRPRSEEHRAQLAIYGLWAHLKHGIPEDAVRLHVEYLAAGKTASGCLAPGELEQVRTRIGQSVADMTEYLEDGDREANRPRPREEWELADDPQFCRYCNFYELCEPELTGTPE